MVVIYLSPQLLEIKSEGSTDEIIYLKFILKYSREGTMYVCDSRWWVEINETKFEKFLSLLKLV